MRLENIVALILAAIGAVSILVAEAAFNWASGSCPQGYSCDQLGSGLGGFSQVLFGLFFMGLFLLGTSALVALNAWTPRRAQAN